MSAKKTSSRGKNTKTRKSTGASKSVAENPIANAEDDIPAIKQDVTSEIPAEAEVVSSEDAPSDTAPEVEGASRADTALVSEPTDETLQEHEVVAPEEEAIPEEETLTEGMTTSDEGPLKASEEGMPNLTTEPEQVTNGGFLPMFLGGVTAAVIGFGACAYLFPNGVFSDDNAQATLNADIQQALNAQSETIAALSDQVNAQPRGLDQAALDNVQADLSASVDELSNRMVALDDQARNILQQLANAQTQTIQGDTSAAYEQDLQALKATVEAMATERRDLEATANSNANEVMKRAAITRLLTALESGSSYRGALTDLQGTGVSVPDTLSAFADDGVTSLSNLQDSYPDAARAALNASRKAETDNDEGSGGFTAFLRTQLGARSLEPREGDDPDAILSRVEAALREARLTDALSEIETLPEAGRAELSDWAGQVAQRQDALHAAERLNQELN